MEFMRFILANIRVWGEKEGGKEGGKEEMVRRARVFGFPQSSFEEEKKEDKGRVINQSRVHVEERKRRRN